MWPRAVRARRFCPYSMTRCFAGDSEDRVIANLGGIAYITILTRDTSVTGFDTGPANRLLDAWISLHGRQGVRRGRRRGRGPAGVDETLLQELLDEPYLRAAPPKSTGRETLQSALAAEQTGPVLAPAPATCKPPCSSSTARSVADAIRQYAPGAALYVCGGGARNVNLLKAISLLIAPNRVAGTEVLGLDPDYVEAIAFAWFAKRTLAGLTSSAAGVTGARGARILGGVYRYA